MKYIWIGIAGAAGALSRYGLGLLFSWMMPIGFSWGTMVINLVGSLLLGVVTGLGAERGLIPAAWRVPLAVGFIGAFTTFSTWMVDTVALLQDGAWGLAVGNLVVSQVGGLLAVWLGLGISSPYFSKRRDSRR